MGCILTDWKCTTQPLVAINCTVPIALNIDIRMSCLFYYTKIILQCFNFGVELRLLTFLCLQKHHNTPLRILITPLVSPNYSCQYTIAIFSRPRKFADQIGDRRLIFPIQLFKMICRYYCHPIDLLTYQQQYRMSNINNISNRMSAINETRPTVIQNHTERETKKKMYCFQI